MTLHEALVDPDPTITATNLVGRWCSGGRSGHKCMMCYVHTGYEEERCCQSPWFWKRTEVDHDKRVSKSKRVQSHAFCASSSWLELCPIHTYLCLSPSYSSSSMRLSAYPPSTSCRTDLYGDHAGVTVNLGDDDSGQSKVSLTIHVRTYARTHVHSSLC